VAEGIEEIRLIARGGSFHIERMSHQGEFSAIELCEANLLSLLPLLQRACTLLLEKHATAALRAQGATPLVAAPVREIVIGNDLHKSEIYLTLIDKDGNRFPFALEPVAALNTAIRLAETAKKLDSEPPKTAQ
jgi:hypothetical protein